MHTRAAGDVLPWEARFDTQGELSLRNALDLLRLATLWSIAVTACASGQRAQDRIVETFPESCHVQCHRDHPDSLYDENKCLEACGISD